VTGGAEDATLRQTPRGDKVDSMKDWSECPEVERSPARVSGAWVFRGSRVPVKALFENLEDGATVDEFLEWFPGVKRDQIEAVLDFAAASLEPLAAG
jgi:uncharacterized protein (DUF433 family)